MSPATLWHRGPLGQELETHLGKPNFGDGWRRAYAAWVQFYKVLILEGSDELLATLSVSQLNSYRLLLEWWLGGCQNKAWARSAKRYIRTEAGSSDADIDDETPMQLQESAEPGGPEYNKIMFALFKGEFYNQGSWARPSEIQHRRRTAAIEAACYRLGYWFHPAPETSEDGDRGSDNLPGNFHRDFKGASIEACPWLSTEQKSGLPYYLWDLETQRTIVVDELRSPPQYTVVSHTWGRWRIGKTGISVKGVPWLVPRNSKFNVHYLPDMLQKSRFPFQSRYVWLDLVCIPQDRSQRTVIEISRQASIFAGADSAVAWLNEINSWDGMKSALHWMTAKYLQYSDATSHPSEDVKNYPSTGLFEGSQTIDRERTLFETPNGWFTSLWTLQEACLRPDMLFCNHKWEVLTDPTGGSIRLDTIAALHDRLRFYMRDVDTSEEEEWPMPAKEVFALMQHTGMDLLLQMSPTTVLSLGSKRECTERRAEAIMSVIGAVNWHRRLVATSKLPDAESLVLDTYPLPFLKEVRDVLGASFFSSNYTYCSFWDVFERGDEGDLVAKVTGTLFPFTPLGLGDPRLVFASESSSWQDHPSVKSWKIMGDGRVKMPRAGILASWDDPVDSEEIIATVMGPGLDPEADQKTLETLGQVNLRQWLRSLFPTVRKHAVSLWQGPNGWSQGFILQDVIGNGKIYAKIGDYYTPAQEGRPMPPTRTVNWEVL